MNEPVITNPVGVGQPLDSLHPVAWLLELDPPRCKISRGFVSRRDTNLSMWRAENEGWYPIVPAVSTDGPGWMVPTANLFPTAELAQDAALQRCLAVVKHHDGKLVKTMAHLHECADTDEYARGIRHAVMELFDHGYISTSTV